MTRTARRTLIGPVIGLITVGLLAAGCGGTEKGSTDGGLVAGPASTSPTTSTGTGTQYVALGDSYAAAPGLPPQDTSPAATGCARSLINYPHLLAKAEPRLTLSDLTCSGATTADLLTQQDTALSADTDLVTVGIGGNDEGLFITLIGGCVQLAKSDPTGSPCTRLGQQTATAALEAIRTNVGAVLDDIAKRAPNARVIVVGYPQLLPADGPGCPTLAPIATGDLPFVTGVNKTLSDDLEAAAKDHGDDFVDVYAASDGHNVCSDKPWVNGQNTSADGVIPFHPLAAEQRAVAALVARLL